jgi:hypothetical protein
MRNLDRSPPASAWPDERIPVVQPAPRAEAIPTINPVAPCADGIPTLTPIPTVLPIVPVLLAEPALPGDPAPELAAIVDVPKRWRWPGLWGAIRLIVGGIASACEWCFGLAALLAFLAMLAALPILQFLTLGYLLEATGRVARSGRLRDGFIGVRVAARAGGIVLGTWLMLLPLRLVSSLWFSAQLIEPDGLTARLWEIGLAVLTVLMLLHIAMAIACGGKLRHFLFPFINPIRVALHMWRGGFWSQSRDAVWNFVAGLRLPYYFWLGWRGFWGAFLWLAGPITLLAIARAPIPGFLAALVGLAGAFTLVWVLLYVPFLQLHFVVRNRFRAFLEVWSVRQHFRRAPLAFAFAFFITLLFAVPLYLLKIEIVPREAAWLPSLVFILFIYPARLLSGWAFGRSLRRKTPRNFFFRWTARFAMLSVTVLYAVIVYFSQYAAWEGIWSLYEQHAFLLPVPFLGL